MSMRLACTRMFPRIEEAKERLSIFFVCLQAIIRSTQIIYLKQICLWLVFLCCKYKVVWNDGIFVEEKEVGWW